MNRLLFPKRGDCEQAALYQWRITTPFRQGDVHPPFIGLPGSGGEIGHPDRVGAVGHRPDAERCECARKCCIVDVHLDRQSVTQTVDQTPVRLINTVVAAAAPLCCRLLLQLSEPSVDSWCKLLNQLGKLLLRKPSVMTRRQLPVGVDPAGPAEEWQRRTRTE